MSAEQPNVEAQEQQRDFEGEAREMGWVPKDDFHEEPEKWIDAEEFVKRGEQVLPILRANNRKLKQEVLTKEAALATLQQTVANQEKALKALKKGYDEQVKHQVEEAKRELTAQLKQAKKDGDVDAEVDLQERLDTLKATERTAKEEAREESPESEIQTRIAPQFKKWNEENPWFGDDSNPTNRKRSRELIRIGEELRSKGETSAGFPFLDRCLEILEERESKRSAVRTPSKVEGGSARSTNKSGRAFDSLSKEAKAACHSDTETFVGPGKMFKTVGEWEDHYASLLGDE